MIAVADGFRTEQVSSIWLTAMRVYLGVMAIGNLTWEIAHLPLYTIWSAGTVHARAFAVVLIPSRIWADQMH